MKEKYPVYNGNVVTTNFFSYLKRRKITQKKYAIDNNLDPSILSKWKSGDSQLTIEQVRQAAKYFGITANDLMYSDIEKKRLEVIADKSYDPILAQQSIDILLFRDTFEKPIKIILFCLFVFPFIALVIYLFRNQSVYYSFLMPLAIPLCVLAIKKNLIEERTFIINYLDQLFYKREDTKNHFYFLSITIRVISLLLVAYIINKATINFATTNEFNQSLLTVLLIILMMSMFNVVLEFLSLPVNFKPEIYDNETDGYNITRLTLFIHFSVFSVLGLLFLRDTQVYLELFCVSCVILLINIFDFVKVSKEYSKYELVYKENEKEARKLFPNIIE